MWAKAAKVRLIPRFSVRFEFEIEIEFELGLPFLRIEVFRLICVCSFLFCSSLFSQAIEL